MNQDFLDLLRELLEANANFLMVGAFAVAVHAEPRATGDLDLWVEPSEENAMKVLTALKKFGAPLHDLTQKDLSHENIVFQMGLPPNRIDILTSISGVKFKDAWPNRKYFESGNLSIPVISKNDLIQNKKSAGRPKDLLDVELLNKF